MIYDRWQGIKAVHKPTGETVRVSADRGLMARSFAQAKAIARKILVGRLATPKPEQFKPLRIYDLTPGFQRIKGGGIFTTDPAEIEAIMERGEIPLRRWNDMKGKSK